MSLFLYVQDERYVAVPRMVKSDGVQDERYVAVPRMVKSDGFQAVPRLPAFTAFMLLCMSMTKSNLLSLLFILQLSFDCLADAIGWQINLLQLVIF